MPDWSYQTVFRPLLFRLPATTARDLTLNLMGTLVRLPGGSAVIDFLGHMRPPDTLACTALGITFPSPLGLGAGLDVNALALPALARFGFGFLEVGPVTVESVTSTRPVERQAQRQAMWYPEPMANPGLAVIVSRLVRAGPLPVPVGIRLGHTPGSSAGDATRERQRLVAALGPHAAFFTLQASPLLVGKELWSEDEWREHLRLVLQAVGAKPLLLGLLPDTDSEKLDGLLSVALGAGVGGVLISGGIAATPPGRLTGPPARDLGLRMVRRLRERHGKDLVILASGGILEPQDALDYFEAGATLVQIHSGLVYSGPGFPKRINDALEAVAPPPLTAAPPTLATPESSWFWLMLMGCSMLVGGILALVIASTRVVLTYDETFVGMNRAELLTINDRLLLFMAHDRVALAGTMIAIGILYTQLAVHGMRRGLHWARRTVLVSAFSGFASFFLFLGHGYFDPFHAFVTAVLLQLLLLGLHCRLPPRMRLAPVNLRNDRPWRLSLWGQLLLIAQGFSLVVAGLVISGVGATHVFVPEDLEFMRTDVATLLAANPRLLPLIAHDRAAFGGMLVACGLAILLAALWGYRQGNRWLWWTFLAGGLAGYLPALGVHYAVGYIDQWHLLPAYAGLAQYLTALGLSYPFLCRTGTMPSGRGKETG